MAQPEITTKHDLVEESDPERLDELGQRSSYDEAEGQANENEAVLTLSGEEIKHIVGSSRAESDALIEREVDKNTQRPQSSDTLDTEVEWDIIRVVAFIKPQDRVVTINRLQTLERPVLDKMGRLLKAYKHLSPRINEAKELGEAEWNAKYMSSLAKVTTLASTIYDPYTDNDASERHKSESRSTTGGRLVRINLPGKRSFKEHSAPHASELDELSPGVTGEHKAKKSRALKQNQVMKTRQPEPSCDHCQLRDCYSLRDDQEGIRCGILSCRTKCFSKEVLDKYCGIELNEALRVQEERREWLCLECKNKKESNQRIMNAVTPAPFSKFPQSGRDGWSQEDMISMLISIELQVKDYCSVCLTGTFDTPIKSSTSFLELDCIKSESETPEAPLFATLRKSLGIGEGVSIQAFGKTLKTELMSRDWMKAMISQVLADFVFDGQSPLKNTDCWLAQFKYLNIPLQMRVMMIRDYHHQFIQSGSPEFMARRTQRIDELVKHLNQTMFSVVGSNHETVKHHCALATMANSLKEKVWTYTGELGSYEVIFPHHGELFDPGAHQLGCEDPPRDERRIMINLMFGVRFHSAGTDPDAYSCVLVRAITRV